MSKWTDLMLTNLSIEKNLPLETIFESLQIIYSGCLQELIRQISIHCVERGQLLHKIWNAYISLFERLMIEQKKASNQTEKSYLMESSRIHKIYQNELEIFKGKLDQATQENEQYRKDHAQISEKHKQMKTKFKKILHDFSIQKVNFDNLRTEFNLIQEENLELKLVFENQSKTKEVEKSDLLFRKLPNRFKKIGSFVEKNLPNKLSDSVNHSEKEILEEDSFEITFEDKCFDTRELFDLIFKEEYTQTDVDTIIQQVEDITKNELQSMNIETHLIKNTMESMTQTMLYEKDNEPVNKVSEQVIQLVKKVSIFAKKKTKPATELKINEESSPNFDKKDMEIKINIKFEEDMKDIEEELESEENWMKKKIKMIDLLNDKCIGGLLSDESTPQFIKSSLSEFRKNIKKTTQSLDEIVNTVIVENQDHKINIIENENDIMNNEEELRRKNEEIEILKENVEIYYLF